MKEGHRDLLAIEGLRQDVCPLITVKVPGWRGMSQRVTTEAMKTPVNPMLLILMDPRELMKEGESSVGLA